jgi:restriction system protein
MRMMLPPAVSVSLVAFLVASSIAHGQPSPDKLYHLSHKGIGCVDPHAAELLADPNGPSRTDPRQLTNIAAAGRCAPIGPVSLWSIVSFQETLALVTLRHSPTTTASVTLYVPRALLVAADQTTLPNTRDVGRPIDLTPHAQQSAEAVQSHHQDVAPPPDPSIQASPAVTQNAQPVVSAPILSRQTVAEPENAARPVSAPAAPVVSPASVASTNDGSGTFVVWFIGIVAAVLGVVAWYAKITQGRKQSALAAVRREIDENASALRVKRIQTVLPDEYGTVSFKKWIDAKQYYVGTRIVPALAAGGFSDLQATLAPEIDALIEAAAQRPITAANETLRYASSPEVFDPRMDPLDYERYCALQLEKAGWQTRLTAATGDQGADVIANRGNRTLIVQCKLYSSPVGNDAVQQAFAARQFQAADLAAVVSNQPFTRSARQLATVNGVALMHHEQLPAFTG